MICDRATKNPKRHGGLSWKRSREGRTIERQCGRLQSEVQTHVADADVLRREHNAAVAAHTSASSVPTTQPRCCAPYLAQSRRSLRVSCRSWPLTHCCNPHSNPQHSVTSVKMRPKLLLNCPFAGHTGFFGSALTSAHHCHHRILRRLATSVAQTYCTVIAGVTVGFGTRAFYSCRRHKSAYSAALRELQHAIDNVRQRAGLRLLIDHRPHPKRCCFT